LQSGNTWYKIKFVNKKTIAGLGEVAASPSLVGATHTNRDRNGIYNYMPNLAFCKCNFLLCPMGIKVCSTCSHFFILPIGHRGRHLMRAGQIIIIIMIYLILVLSVVCSYLAAFLSWYIKIGILP
jgi:hypothetical protein